MSLPDCSNLELALDGGVLAVTLNRPQAKNAISLEMVAELRATVEAVQNRRDVRVLVLRGAGGTFCAGGDVKDMRTVLAAPEDERRRRAEDWSRAFGGLLGLLDGTPQVVVAAVEGTVMGGGLGLVSVADVAAATEDARFALPETTLGLVPAQIAPFVIRRIGLSEARRLALTGASFGGREARALGLVHHLCAGTEAIDAWLAEVLGGIRRCAPRAVAATKKLMNDLAATGARRLADETARAFADALLGPEGREGTRALVEKRPPGWSSG